MFDLKAIIVFLIAVVPAGCWLYLFLRQQKEGKWLVFLTFVGGMVAAQLILIYQGYWGETVNFIFFKVNPVDFKRNIEELLGSRPLLALFLSFVGVGVIEEYAKFWIMRLISHRFFRSINDVIELAVISALGFAFLENMIYFGQHWGQLPAGNFFVFATMRVTVVTMVHVLCSGLLGYYYGMAFFASPMLKIQRMKKKTHPVLVFLKNILHLKKSHVYHDEMIVIGLTLSMVIHGLYDFILTIEASVFHIPLMFPVIFLYFFGGFWLLSRLFKNKDHQLKLGLVGTRVMPKEDFVKLLEDINRIKEQMREEVNQNSA